MPVRRGGKVNLQGQDHHARILVELEDSYTGATRQITLRMPELTPDGHVLSRDRTLNVRIPKGIREGQQIRLAGQGGAGLGDAGAGDLYLEWRLTRMFATASRVAMFTSTSRSLHGKRHWAPTCKCKRLPESLI